ncbi:MAG TPA: glucodextranase DOMON-like domain-containing protein [Thermoleophilaceae bacterium]|nr:glucodextranase DOMON-like domain-containing protein [Thermoleophilaceae bacterium]
MQGRVIALSALCALAIAAPAGAATGSLYNGPGPRPGPDILYAPPANAPQLQNTGIWRAPPILVSGASAYRDGEFLYQDYLYDDHGANGGAPDPGDPRLSGDTFSMPNGTYTYPTNPVYAGNAADLVELRVKTTQSATAFRITLNTMKDPSLVATTIAIGNSDQAQQFPHGANASAPAQWFVTVHGQTADMINADTGKQAPTAPTVSVDTTRRQITVLVPHSDWNPGAGTVRLAAGTGLWDKAAGKYLIPQQSADATHPGGAGTLSNPTAFFNVAFRFSEPMPDATNPVTTATNAAWWRDQDQGQALKNGDLTPFHADVDFAKLAHRVNDDSGVPKTGAIDRILASHFETEQGTDYSTTCQSATACKGELRGQLQPYAIYVPKQAQPASGYGLTLLLHSLGANYNQFEGSRNQSQIGDRGPGSIVITPEGRGPDGWYYDYAGADTFEVWADVAAHYKLDPNWTAISGYSMGGYGTYKFATQYPDLFAKAQPVVGPPGLGVWVPPAPVEPGGDSSNTNHMLASVRNVPFLIWDAVTDELVPYAGVVDQANTFDQLGYRYEFDSFAPADHLTLAINDQYQPAANFLGTTTVDRNPAHVTYVVNPKMDFPEMGGPANHAYWLSGLTLRDASGSAPLGTIDVRSEGFGVSDPVAGATQHGAGALTGGTLPAIAYTSQSKQWGPALPALRRDRLDINAQNVSAVTIDPSRAHVSCGAALNVQTDGPVSVTLAGCGRTEQFGG